MVQINELTRKITDYEEDVQTLIDASSKQAAINEGPDDDEHAQHAGEGDEAGVDSSDDSDDVNEDQFIELEEDLANVIADVHDLGKQTLTPAKVAHHSGLGLGLTSDASFVGHFSHLNYTGFIKIVKKHDVSRSAGIDRRSASRGWPGGGDAETLTTTLSLTLDATEKDRKRAPWAVHEPVPRQAPFLQGEL